MGCAVWESLVQEYLLKNLVEEANATLDQLIKELMID